MIGRNRGYSKDDLEFVSSLKAAMLEKTTRKSRAIARLIVLVVVCFLIWAYYTKIDEITRGSGKIIPSQKIQVIQNLEGGIVARIMVQTGQIVNKGEALIQIDNKMFESSFGERQLKIDELTVNEALLRAQATEREPVFDADLAVRAPELIANARSLYRSHRQIIENQARIIKDQITQKNDEIKALKGKITHLTHSAELIAQEIALVEPLVETGLESKVDLLKLRRESSSIAEKLSAAQLAIPRLRTAISELKKKEQMNRLAFQKRAKQELAEVAAMMSQLKKLQDGLEDKVKRTLVTSPVRGTVKQLFVNTLGGVVRPGMDLVEIVPIDDTLLVEAKIKPSDIAFLYPGQRAVVKVTAYDYAIYGGLEGKVTTISADTIIDERQQSYYLVMIVTDKNYLGSTENVLSIIPGMVVSVDIITGKKSIMDYILKPILRAKETALTER